MPRDFVGVSNEAKGLSVMQDAVIPRAGLGLLCKHVARKKAQAGLGWVFVCRVRVLPPQAGLLQIPDQRVHTAFPTLTAQDLCMVAAGL